MQTYYAFTARAALAGLSLILTLATPAPAANLRFEREARKEDDGRQLESINRVFDFDDATELRFKTTQVSGSNELYSRKWGDYFFGLSFGRNGNGGWDIWDFLQVHSQENKKPVAYMRQRLPDSVSFFEQSGQILAECRWSSEDGRRLRVQIRKFRSWPKFLFFRVLWEGAGWESPTVTLAAYPGNSDKPPERERWVATREESFPLAIGARELTLASDGLALFNKYRYEDFGNLLVVNHQSLQSLLLPQTNYHVRVILRPLNPQACSFALSFFHRQHYREVLERFLAEEADAARAFLDEIDWEPELEDESLQRLQKSLQVLLDSLPPEDNAKATFSDETRVSLAQAAKARDARDMAAYTAGLEALQVLQQRLVQHGLNRFR
ncbi:MAG TPA: hypothetical protein PKY10_05690 [Lentisphaeria bacterium]|nr:hypothetical protein [Lentisphaeria bacterium]